MIILLQTFIFTVNFFIGDKIVGSGKVAERSAGVHGYQLLSNEVKILVTELYGDATTHLHPLYNYDMEKESFIQWKLHDIKVTKS